MNALVPLAGGLPSVFASYTNLPDLNAAAQQGLTAAFAVIGYKGKNWRIKHRGEEELVMSNGAPVPHLNVIIVGVSPNISKQFYDKKYTEGDDGAPDCFSIDGVKPDVGSPKKQCATCAACPKNVWGSRITEAGKKAKACQDSRRIAVVPSGDILNEGYGGPMLLRIPPTSLNNLAALTRELQRYGAQPFMVETQLSFDYNVAYPLITFKATGWVQDPAAAAQIHEVMQDPLIDRMLTEAVAAAEHDPEAAQHEQSALAGGSPAAFAQTQPAGDPAPAAPVQPSVQHHAPMAAPAQPAQAAGKPSPFASGAKPSAAPSAAPAPAAPVQQPVDNAQAQVDHDARRAEKLAAADAGAPTTVVQQAPTELESEIDKLLGNL